MIDGKLFELIAESMIAKTLSSCACAGASAVNAIAIDRCQTYFRILQTFTSFAPTFFRHNANWGDYFKDK